MRGLGKWNPWEELDDVSYIAAVDIAIADTSHLDYFRAEECGEKGLVIGTDSGILQRNTTEGAVGEVDSDRALPLLNFGCEALTFQDLLNKSDALAESTIGRIYLIALGGLKRETLEQIAEKAIPGIGADLCPGEGCQLVKHPTQKPGVIFGQHLLPILREVKRVLRATYLLLDLVEGDQTVALKNIQVASNRCGS